MYNWLAFMVRLTIENKHGNHSDNWVGVKTIFTEQNSKVFSFCGPSSVIGIFCAQ
ncbi:MAG: hypothetical protein OFPII_16690 [Osedax symbiont Rs1]|nr:MAG: hypothetical protein OFPII_16690 [Osedax symbiont Rs1]